MGRGRSKKRKHGQFAEDLAERDSNMGIGATLAHLHREDKSSTPDDPKRQRTSDSEEWTTVGRGGKKQKKANYPALGYSELHRLQAMVNINHLQGLVLYCIADGNMAPSWVSVRHHHMVKKAVVLFVPGLEKGMFNGSIDLQPLEKNLIDISENGNGADAHKESIDLSEQPDGANQSTEDRNNSVPLIDVSKVINGTDGSVQDEDTFGTTVAVDTKQRPESNDYNPYPLLRSPDDYLPMQLLSDKLPSPLKPLADSFAHVWPVKAPGDEKYGKVHSPLHAMLNSPITKTQEEKREEKQIKGPKPAREGKNWENKRTPVTRFIASKDQLQENEYLLHHVLFTDSDESVTNFGQGPIKNHTTHQDWVETDVEVLEHGNVADEDIQKGSITAGRGILAMDCEMCRIEGGEMALTRISLVEWDGSIVMDELVKPDVPIVDYLTPYSGMTAAKLENITTTLRNIQKRLLELVTSKHILIGHSLNADLLALKFIHPFVVDTSILYPHPRGPPMKSSLKWLAQKYLGREIQKGHGTMGHDSIEDARACLDLVKLKCERGPQWGTSEATNESIFKRLKRASKPGMPKNDINNGKTGAIIDHGAPEKNFGAMASYCIGCKDDAEVVAGVKRAVLGDEDGSYIPGGGVDFTWARFQELAALRGWLLDYRHSTISKPETEPSPAALAAAVAKTVQHIKSIRDFLPPCTILIVCSGTGDPREMVRLQEMQRTFKREYQTKKWDDLSVKWTDVKEQGLKAAVRRAREGVGFVTII